MQDAHTVSCNNNNNKHNNNNTKKINQINIAIK